MTMARDRSLDLDLARERFEESTDFTCALEEEFAILDPATLDLAHGFVPLGDAAPATEPLHHSLRGELIDTEVEIRSGRSETFTDLVASQRRNRRVLFALAAEHGYALGSAGTHPWASYMDQEIIDTDHYSRLHAELGYVAERNNTWSLHAHVGVRGADRAVAVCDSLRNHLPVLLALSASSPFLDGRDTGLASVRTQIFTRSFWDSYAAFVDLLERTGSIVESTQLWWSVRPHHSFGTVEVRICDAQGDGDASLALGGLLVACVAQAAFDYDDGALAAALRAREIEENLWRAIRHGLDGRMIDFDVGEEIETKATLERLVAWTAPAREVLALPEPPLGPNDAQVDRERLAEGASIEEIYRESGERTKRTFSDS